MLFERASALIVSSEFTTLEEELAQLKKSLAEEDTLQSLDSLYANKEVDKAAPADNEEGREEGASSESSNYKVSISRTSPQVVQAPVNLPLSPTTVSNTQTASGPDVTDMSIKHLGSPNDNKYAVVINPMSTAAKSGATFIVQQPQAQIGQTTTNGQEILLDMEETDPMEAAGPLNSVDSVQEDICSMETEAPPKRMSHSTIKIQDLSKVSPANEYMEIEIPDGADDLAEELGNVIANTSPLMPKGTIIVQQPVQTLMREKPVAGVKVQDIQVLSPDVDQVGTSVAGMDMDQAFRFL